MKNLVGVRVSYSAEKTGIRERTLERVVLAPESRFELVSPDLQRLGAASVELGERILALYQRDGCAPLGAGLRQNQRTVVKVERSESEPAGKLRAGSKPAQAAGDHEVNHDPEIAIESDRDALS